MAGVTKTNALRLLDAAKIPYTTAQYAYDESDLSGVHAARELGMPEGQMFKTLVARGDKTGFLVFCIPVAEELDLKQAASVSGNKKVELIHVRELPALTGYLRGGCSPVGMKKRFPTYIDLSAREYENIAVSAGQRGVQMLLSPSALAEYTGAGFFALTVSA